MRILICNDDGEHSPGLKILIDFARSIADEVFVIVPAKQRSAGGHGITIFRPLSLFEKEKNFFTTDGTPADCVILGLHHVLKNKKPDFMFSGINIGSNLCDHVIYSGTVAAAREAALHGVKSIAFSQVYKKDMFSSSEVNFEISKKFLPEIFEKVSKFDFSTGFYNINFPDFINQKYQNCGLFEDLIEFTKLGKFQRHESALETVISPRNSKYFWINQSEKFEKMPCDGIRTDAEASNDGKISITKLRLDLSLHSES